jgi:hypothetical protein
VQVGEQAEELALTQEDENSRNLPTAGAMDPLAITDPRSASTSGSVPQRRPGSSSDRAPTNQIRSASHSPPEDTWQLLEDSRAMGDTKADGSAEPSRFVAGSMQKRKIQQMPPVVNRPRTRLQDNIVKPKIFSDGMVWYDRKGLGVTREQQTLGEALGDEKLKEAMD